MLSTDRDLSFRKRYLPLEQSGPLQVLLSCCGCLVPAWDDRIHLAFVQRLYRSNVVTHQTRGTTVLSLQFPELVELRKEEKIFSLWPLSNRNSTTISFSTVFFSTAWTTNQKENGWLLCLWPTWKCRGTLGFGS